MNTLRATKNGAKQFTLVAAVFSGVKESDPETKIVLLITERVTVFPDNTTERGSYHYQPIDFKGKWSYEVKCIGFIDFDPKSDNPGSFVKAQFPGVKWTKISWW